MTSSRAAMLFCVIQAGVGDGLVPVVTGGEKWLNFECIWKIELRSALGLEVA